MIYKKRINTVIWKTEANVKPFIVVIMSFNKSMTFFKQFNFFSKNEIYIVHCMHSSTVYVCVQYAQNKIIREHEQILNYAKNNYNNNKNQTDNEKSGFLSNFIRLLLLLPLKQIWYLLRKKKIKWTLTDKRLYFYAAETQTTAYNFYCPLWGGIQCIFELFCIIT